MKRRSEGTAVLTLAFMFIASSPSFALGACPAGQYTTPAGVCAQCPLPTQYSPGGAVTTCSACAAGSMISGTGCTTCAAGKFSSARASTACHACPSGTASLASAGGCVRCDASGTARLANGLTSAPACNTTCTACVPGRYNTGVAKRCSSCAAGKFSAEVRAVSASTCALCLSGQTTLPTATGASVCIACATVNILSPRSARYESTADPLECAWACNTGYTRFNYSEAAYTPATFTALGYSASQSLSVFHNRNDFCCEPSTVLTGMYMCGAYPPTCAPACSRTTDGDSAACAPVASAHFIQGGKNRFNRCDDWACDDYFFLNTTSDVCTAQPACAAGFTYQRDSVTGAYVVLPSGSYVCVPCSQCIDGSETAVQCSRVNDTVCQICAPTAFSYRAGACTSAVPPGFGPVRVRLTSIPVVQGRPSAFYDGTPVVWSGINFAQGFFLNTFTPCQTPASAALMFIGGDETCNRMDLSPPLLCALPLCKVQCRPWNGAEGYYRLNTGDCARCVYDTSCTSAQYSDMTTCGPATAPRCLPCPTIPLPNALGWLNPGRTPFPGPYPCDFVCRDGFAKGANYSCIPCPLVPSNSKITGGCNWTCSLGFTQDRTACIPCASVPTGCATGYYLGYAAATSQCARCLPCTNLVANAAYVSAGRPNGPNTCGTRCLANTFVSPGYGFDTFDNPVACDRCSTPACAEGATYLRPCAYLADAECVPCSACPVGARTLTQCSQATNTTCGPCDASLLPSHASWTEPECARWVCDADYTLDPNTTTCLRCKSSADCIYSDSYEDDSDGAGCGRCVACDSFLLLPGQCFNGDGQCGVSYWCDPGMLVAETPQPQSSVAAASVAAEAMRVVGEEAAATPLTDTLQPPPPPGPILAYASMATLTLSVPPTADLIAEIEAALSADCACNASVTAITHDNTTLFCAAPVCSNGVALSPPQTRRRLLLLTGDPYYRLDITLVRSYQFTAAPGSPPCSAQVTAWQPYEAQAIRDPSLLRDRRRMVVHFKRSGVPCGGKPVEVNWDQYYLTLGLIFTACAVVLLAAGGGTVYYVRVYDQGGGYGAVQDEDDLEPEAVMVVKNKRMMVLPGSWNQRHDAHKDN